jgi:hypothetical protein
MAFFGGGFALDESWRPYIPFWSETTLASSLLSGDAITWLPWLVTATGYLAVICLSLWWISRTIRRQALAGQS